MNACIEVKDLCFAYRYGASILTNLNFRLDKGVFLSIAGPNGAGKTTLLNLLAGLIRPSSGSIIIDSKLVQSYSIRRLAAKVAFVRQEFVPVFDFTAAQVVSMGRTPYLGALAFESEADRKAITEAFEMTDTAQFADRPLAQLSGGERQQIFIARALAQQTPILFLDEPTSFLDMKHRVGIYDLLKQMQLEKQKTIVAVTHDINLCSQYSDMTLLLSAPASCCRKTAAGASYTFGPTDEILTAEQVEKVFGVETFSGKIGQRSFFLPLGKFTGERPDKTSAGENL